MHEPGITRRVGLALLFILAVFAVYQPALTGDFLWDDADYLTENELLRTDDGLRRMWLEPRSLPQYYPMVHTTFWVQYRMHGPNPVPYHILNVLLHALNALLLYALLRYLRVPGAWLAAALFAFHPIQVESVAWITQRKYVLSGLFYFASLLAFCRYFLLADRHDPDAPPVPTYGSWLWYGAGTILFFGALFSKTVTCTLPAALALLIWGKRGRWTIRQGLELAPLLAIGIAAGLATVWLETHPVPATGQEWSLSLVERLLVAGRVIWFYVYKILAPFNMTFIYPRWMIDASVWWAWLFPLSVLLVVIAFWFLRRRWGRGPLTAALFYVGTLFPALGFFDVHAMRFSFVADHFQYHAGVGVIVLVAAFLAHRVNAVVADMFVKEQNLTRAIMGAVGLALLILIGAASWKQAHIYQNETALWRDTVRKNPDAWIAHNHLGLRLKDEGRHDEAAEHFARAIERHPDLVDVPFNKAVSLQESGQPEMAEIYYRRVLDLLPRHHDAHLNLSLILFEVDRVEEAHYHLGRALQIRTRSTDALLQEGARHYDRGAFHAATEYYREAARTAPDDADIHLQLGRSLSRLDRAELAAGHYQQAIRLRPAFAEAWHDLGLALEQMNRGREAIRCYERALQLRPDFEAARRQLNRLRDEP